MRLEIAYADGQLAALEKYAWPAPTDATVAGSAVLREKQPASTPPLPAPPTTPQSLTQIFDAHEQGKTRTEPKRKLSAELCTTCRKERHYGACDSPRKIPTKAADFNPGMLGSDPRQGNDPAMSPGYHSATTADSALARARDALPADVQAQTAFADLFRHQGITNNADEPGRMTGGLNKVAFRAPKLADWRLWGTDAHSPGEQRGPSVNPYEQRLTVKSPPLGWGDEGPQRIERAFDQIDCAADSTSIENSAQGAPSGGPAV